jgi:hypothetical protein
MSIETKTTGEETKMEIVFGGVAFVVLFAAWVIVPSIVKKRHAVKSEEEIADF